MTIEYDKKLTQSIDNDKTNDPKPSTQIKTEDDPSGESFLPPIPEPPPTAALSGIY